MKSKFDSKKRSASQTLLALRSKEHKGDEMIALQTSQHVWDRAWQMVETRAHAADMLFVYAVRTTGIYCRPSCPSRRPLRDSVEFFATSELAERAGYRACKRCTSGNAHPQAHLLTQACDYLERHLDEAVGLDMLGKFVGLSAFHTQRIFRRYLGISPRQYQQSRRMEQFRQGLLTSESVTTAMYDAGFGSSSRLYESSSQHLGMSPTAYRTGGRGVDIRYSIADSPLGKMLVAMTDVGVCAIAFGSLESELEDELANKFPESDRQRDDARLGAAVKQILGQMTEHPVALELPLDVRATAFQRRVWEALRRIPRGETRSYAEIAKEIGQPTAVRAVARACATNPVAVVVPCHRVIGSDGKLTGYRWGMERKKKLLEMERR